MDLQIDHTSDRNKQIDEFTAMMVNNFDLIKEEINHIFTKDLYAREMRVPAGNWVVSKIHKTEHIYIVSKGELVVWDDNGDAQFIKAGDSGVTGIGTRRVAYVLEDCAWTTIHHRLEGETEADIEERIIEKHENPLLTQEMQQKLDSVTKKTNDKSLTI